MLLREEVVLLFVREIRRHAPGMDGSKFHVMYLERFGRGYRHMVGRDRMEAIIAEPHQGARRERQRGVKKGKEG